MFDLFRSRQKTARYVLGGLLGLVALSLVITLIPGYGGGMGGGQDQTILAEIGGDTLTSAEVRETISRELRNRAIQPGMEQLYAPLLVRQMIADRAVAWQAVREGFSASDEELAAAIQGMLPMLFEGGKFAGREAYAQTLAQINLTPQRFEANIRKQIAMNKLESLAIEGVVVTPDEVEREFRFRNEKVKLSYVALTAEKLRNEVKVSGQEVEEFFKKMAASYTIPQKKSYAIYAIEEDKIRQAVQVSEQDVRRAYDSQRDRWQTPERVSVRHILLKTTDQPAPEVEKIRQRAADLLKQIRGGADFAELAKKNSEDTGTAVKGGELGFITRGQTVPEFEKAAFSLKPGEVSDLVTTMYGIHILRVEGKEPARTRPFEEVRAELSTEIARGAVFERMQSAADQLRAALARSPAEADKIVQANAITTARAEKAGAGDPIPEVGVSEQFNEAVAALPAGGVSQPVTVGTNKIVVAQVTAIEPARPARFDEVKDQVRTAIAAQRAQQLLQEKMKAAFEKAKAGADLAALAKELGVEVKTTSEFGRDGSPEGLGAAAQYSEAFRLQVGQVFGPVDSASGSAICKVVGRVEPDLTRLAAERDSLILSIKSRRAGERRELFRDGLVNELIRQKKVKVYEDNIKLLASSYRG
jgi:peptidyl-prolyl cis-trans isomerase D